MTTTDVLMITYKSPDYVRLSLPRLLDSMGDDNRVWLWHNGTDEETLEVVKSHLDDARVARFRHSLENRRLHEPTQWLWTESRADLLGKVDDDCLVDVTWTTRFAQFHRDWERLGVVGSWRFREEDYVESLTAHKIVSAPGGHQILRNPWVQGSGYLMKRAAIERHGPLRPTESFTQYCKRLARKGYVNGWYFPFVCEDHMDDPRSPNTGLKTDADLLRRLPLSAQARGIRTLAAWTREQHEYAIAVQSASIDGVEFTKRQKLLRRVRALAERAFKPRASSG